jgi:hypothetical protein
MLFRDLAQLEPNARSAIEAVRILWQQYQMRSEAYASLGGAIDEWSKCEPSGSFELRSLRVLSQAISFSSPHVGALAEAIKTNVYDPISFLEGTCLDSARASCEKLNKMLPRTALNSYSHSTHSSGSSGSGGVSSKRVVAGGASETDNIHSGDGEQGDGNGIDWVDREKERESAGGGARGGSRSSGISLYAEDLDMLRQVVSGTKCWDSTRRIRSMMISSNVVQCVNKLVAEVSREVVFSPQ